MQIQLLYAFENLQVLNWFMKDYMSQINGRWKINPHANR
jgi:hypothetical protein